jgi:hypothetical protein
MQHPIYSNSGEVTCGYRPKKGINIARCCVTSYSITAATAKSVTHMSFGWCVYQAQSNGGKYSTRPVAWGTGSVRFSVRGDEVLSEPLEPFGTPGCIRRKLGLSLMRITMTICGLYLTIAMIIEMRIHTLTTSLFGDHPG